MIVDNAVYVEGRRTEEPRTLQETYEAVRKRRGVAWIGLYKPTEEEFSSVAGEFGLHPLAVEDAIKAHQRPKLERYDRTLFLVLKAARYIDETETVDFGEIDVFVGEDFVVTVRHGEAAALGEVRRRLEGEPELLRRGTEAILYAIMDRVVDGYVPVLGGLENDIDEIETEVFSGNAGVSRRIYELSREVIVPAYLASVLVIRYADLERRKHSRFGRYMHRYMNRRVEVRQSSSDVYRDCQADAVASARSLSSAARA